MHPYPNSSQECPTDSVSPLLPGLSRHQLAPFFVPFVDQTYNKETPLTLLDFATLIPNPTMQTPSDILMLDPQHEPLELFNQPHPTPVSSSSASSEVSSVSLRTPSHPSSTFSHSSEDWLAESMSNLDTLAPTVPDLSFSFITPQTSPHSVSASQMASPVVAQESPVVSLLADSQDPALGLAEDDTLLTVPLENNTKLSNPTSATTRNPTPRQSFYGLTGTVPRSGHTSVGSTTPLLNGGSLSGDRSKNSAANRKSYGFLLSGGTTNKWRNSSSLERQLDFLAQHQSPTYTSNTPNTIDLDIATLVAAPQDPPEQEDTTIWALEKHDPSPSTSKQEAQPRRSRFSRWGSHSDHPVPASTKDTQDTSITSAPRHPSADPKADRRQSRSSSSRLFTRANRFFTATRSLNRDSTLHEDPSNGAKAWLDPTLPKLPSPSNPSASRPKASRSLFTLFNPTRK